MNISQELITSYLETQYIVYHTDIVITINEQNPLLDQLLRDHNVTEWAYISAWNPYSKSLADEENNLRHSELLSLTKQYTTMEGEGRGTDPSWTPEKSLLILGINREEAMKLGRYFEQNAIVVGMVEGRGELVETQEIE